MPLYTAYYVLKPEEITSCVVPTIQSKPKTHCVELTVFVGNQVPAASLICLILFLKLFTFYVGLHNLSYDEDFAVSLHATTNFISFQHCSIKHYQ